MRSIKYAALFALMMATIPVALIGLLAHLELAKMEKKDGAPAWLKTVERFLDWLNRK